MGFLKPVNPAKYPYIAKTPGRRAAPGGVHHGRAEIGGDDLALRADALGGQKACLAGDRRKFQDRPAGSGIDLVDEPSETRRWLSKRRLRWCSHAAERSSDHCRARSLGSTSDMDERINVPRPPRVNSPRAAGSSRSPDTLACSLKTKLHTTSVFFGTGNRPSGTASSSFVSALPNVFPLAAPLA